MFHRRELGIYITRTGCCCFFLYLYYDTIEYWLGLLLYGMIRLTYKLEIRFYFCVSRLFPLFILHFHRFWQDHKFLIWEYTKNFNKLVCNVKLLANIVKNWNNSVYPGTQETNHINTKKHKIYSIWNKIW